MQFDHLKRREFITLLGGAAAAWPLTARAQQAVPVIGFLSSASSEREVAAFRAGLKEVGFVEGHNVTVEYRWAHDQDDRLSTLAVDLVRRQVNVIFATSNAATLAAKPVTATIPIVFAVGFDPVAFGLVASLSRPGGNLTGMTTLNAELGPKRLELMHELIPSASSIALLVNQTNPATETDIANARDAANSLGLKLHVLHASTEHEIHGGLRRLGSSSSRRAHDCRR